MHNFLQNVCIIFLNPKAGTLANMLPGIQLFFHFMHIYLCIIILKGEKMRPAYGGIQYFYVGLRLWDMGYCPNIAKCKQPNNLKNLRLFFFFF